MQRDGVTSSHGICATAVHHVPFPATWARPRGRQPHPAGSAEGPRFPNLENGARDNITLANATKLADALGISLDLLARGSLLEPEPVPALV
jgi:hypothetical protein